MSSIDSPAGRPGLTDGAAFALSALAAFFWGTNFEAARVALEQLSPWAAAAGRFILAAASLLGWLWLRGGLDLAVLRRNWPAFATLGLLGLAGFNAALFVGLQTANPITAALIMGTTPLTTNLLDALVEGRRPRAVALLGMAISLLGVALTVGAFAGARFAPGDFLILAGSLFWALYTIGCRRWVRDATALETATWTTIAGAIGLAALALALGDPLRQWAAAGLRVDLTVIYMALFGTVLAYIFFQIGIAVRGPGPTSVLFNLVPVAALFTAMLAGRLPQPTQIAGVAVAIGGILLASGRLRLSRRRG